MPLFGLCAGRANISGLPDGRETWIAHSTPYYRQFGMTFTGFAISGNAPQMDPTAEAIYVNFSANGLVNQGWPGQAAHLTNNMPVFVQTDLGADPAQGIVSMFNATDEAAQFHMFRAVLVSPTFLAQVDQEVQNLTTHVIILLDPIKLGYLARIQFGGSNDNRVAYIGDTIPSSIGAGTTINASVTIRNDGWNDLLNSNHSVVLSWLQDDIYIGDVSLVSPCPANPQHRRQWAKRHQLRPAPLSDVSASSDDNGCCSVHIPIPGATTKRQGDCGTNPDPSSTCTWVG
jgi:hypothetical protein